MTRWLAGLSGLLLASTAVARPVPLPPPLPRDPPADQAAPVPDRDVLAPSAAGAGGTEFAMHLYRMREFGTADAYVPGSAYQAPEQRKPMQTPGFLITVPLR